MDLSSELRVLRCFFLGLFLYLFFPGLLSDFQIGKFYWFSPCEEIHFLERKIKYSIKEDHILLVLFAE